VIATTGTSPSFADPSPIVRRRPNYGGPNFALLANAFTGLDAVALPVDDASARLTGVSRVENWNGFSAWLDGRFNDDPALPLYLDSGGQVGDFAGITSNPADLAPIENPHFYGRSA